MIQCSLYLPLEVQRRSTDLVSPVSLVAFVVAMKVLYIADLPGNHGGNRDE
jgi:hypothetical protein